MQIELPITHPERACYSWFSDVLSALEVDQDGGWPDRFGRGLRPHVVGRLRKEIRVLSLFSGGGGLDIGFHDAGFSIIECNEIEKDFAKTLDENSSHMGYLAGSKIVCKDIREYTPNCGPIDFIIGGPPCQTFSAAGARAAGVNGTDDERGNLFLEYARILEQLSPRGFLFENVYRIIGAQRGAAWEKIQEAFRSLGYILHWRILDAADFGVPQFRERLFIVGLKEGTYKFPFPTHGPDSLDKRPYYTASAAVSDIDVSDCKTGLGGRHGHLLYDIPPGLNYSFYTDKLGHPKPIFGWRSKFSDYLYKADPNRPVRTIKAQGGQYTGPFSWENRPFNVEELKRLQTFPDEYRLIGNRQKAIHQLGNSVPPQIARILALSIMDQVFGIDLGFNIQAMPDNFSLGFRRRKAQLTSYYSRLAEEAIAQIRPSSTQGGSSIADSKSYAISSDFGLLENPSANSVTYCGQCTVDAAECKITIKDGSRKSIAYRISVRALGGGLGPIAAEAVDIEVYSTKKESIIAAWKYFEIIVKKYAHKDDLVQLFGYYQYKQCLPIAVELVAHSLKRQPFWLFWKKVSEGRGVGDILAVESLQHIFGVQKVEVRELLSTLKKCGYEIRSNNTNKQIPEGTYLIPYSFPSLNERSLQRLVNL